MWPEVIKLGIEVVKLVRDVTKAHHHEDDRIQSIKDLTAAIKEMRKVRDNELDAKFPRE